MVKITKKMPAQHLKQRSGPRASIAKKVIGSVQQAPTAFGSITRNMKPRFSSGGDGIIVVDHCEYIGPVVTDVTNEYAYDVYPLDLGDGTSFPWGSKIAQLYESGSLEALDVIFKSSTQTSGSGLVEIGIDYDAADATDNVTERMLLNWEDSLETNVWLSAIHRSRPKNLKKVLKERFQSESGADKRLSSFGNVYVSTTTTNLVTFISPSVYTTVTLGHIYFRYRMRLTTPTLNSSLGLGSLAVEPQINVVTNTNNSGLSSNDNALSGMAAVDNPASVSQLDETYGCEIFRPSFSGEYVSTNGDVAADTMTLLKFAKDFEGIMTFSMNQCSSGAANAAPVITQFRKSNNPVPDLVRNVFNGIAYNLVAATSPNAKYNFVMDVVAAAGTVIKIAIPLYASANAAIKYLGMAPTKRYASQRLTQAALSSSSSSSLSVGHLGSWIAPPPTEFAQIGPLRLT